ncbi:MAG TPA: hypothetical protein VK116_09150 [Planctomycetota bacterium]|nr:hypothetical protein [Planctomycetota bacterium]
MTREDSEAPLSDSHDERAFGEQVWLELRERSILLSELKYEGIQRLRDASREETAKLLEHYGELVARAVEEGTPAQVAQQIAERRHVEDKVVSVGLTGFQLGLTLGWLVGLALLPSAWDGGSSWLAIVLNLALVVVGFLLFAYYARKVARGLERQARLPEVAPGSSAETLYRPADVPPR